MNGRCLGVVVVVAVLVCCWGAGAGSADTTGMTWHEYAGNPVIDQDNNPRSYYPSVIYDTGNFGGAYEFKVWYSSGSADTMYCEGSNDGKSWTGLGSFDFDAQYEAGAQHPWVVYDAGGFGGTAKQVQDVVLGRRWGSGQPVRGHQHRWPIVERGHED